MTLEERIAERFHEAYERLAPEHGYETRTETSVPWDELPESNRSLMVAVVAELLLDDVVEAGEAVCPEKRGGQG